MNLQSFRQNLGVFAGVIVFSFNFVTTAQTYNPAQVQVRVVFADGTPLVNAGYTCLGTTQKVRGAWRRTFKTYNADRCHRVLCGNP